MEQKLARVPFEVELAKRISNGNEEGRIVTRGGDEARIVCWDYKSMSGDYPILALINQGKQEKPIPYSKEGRYNVYGYFSEDCLDLMLETPEYMTFKDGDVLYVRLKNNNWYIFIYSCNSEHKTNSYTALGDNGRLWIEDDYITSNDYISELRFATEEEKQTLIDALKASKEPKAKEYLKRFFNIEVKPECKFKPKDWVLCKGSYSSIWTLCRFSHIEDNINPRYVSVGGNCWHQCIPYNEQTKHLLGTTDNWEE